MAIACQKPVRWKPLTGLLDNRCDPDSMPPYSVRYRLNWWPTESGKLERLPGFEKLFTSSSYNNEDLHDQLLAHQTYYEDDGDDTTDDSTVTSWPSATCSGPLLTRSTGRQPISLLFSATSGFGSRALIAATESRIYRLNNGTGNWKLLADGMGEQISDGTCPKRRFRADQLNDAVLFTNDWDVPQYWLFDQLTYGCLRRAIQPIPGLDVIGLTRAKFVWTFKSVPILANVEMDGERKTNRIVWGDYNQLSFDPAVTSSIAGYQDLDNGEEIIGGAEINNEFLIYTNRGIWQMTAVGDPRVFSFDKRYTPDKNGEGTLFYPNTLVSTGGYHIFLGRDGLYVYNLYLPSPERVEWADYGTGDLFTDISVDCCENHTAVYDPDRRLYMVSYAEATNHCCPTKTILVSMDHQFVSYMDEGFSAFCVFARESRETLREWIVDNCVCSPSELRDVGFDYVKEGLPRTEAEGSCQDIDAIFTDTAMTTGGSVIVTQSIESPSVISADSTSLCSAMDGELIEDECDDCKPLPTIIGAAVQDFCLKQLWTAYVREMCVNPFAVGSWTWEGYRASVGEYSDETYDSVLRSGCLNSGEPGDTILRKVEFEIQPEVQSTPAEVSLRTGQAGQAVDPNETRCTIIWNDEGAKDLECLAGGTEAELEAQYLRADDIFDWSTWTVGRHIYWELTISGSGGACSVTGAYFHLSTEKRNERG
jgi:hypothetical protein